MASPSGMMWGYHKNQKALVRGGALSPVYSATSLACVIELTRISMVGTLVEGNIALATIADPIMPESKRADDDCLAHVR